MSDDCVYILFCLVIRQRINERSRASNFPFIDLNYAKLICFAQLSMFSLSVHAIVPNQANELDRNSFFSGLKLSTREKNSSELNWDSKNFLLLTLRNEHAIFYCECASLHGQSHQLNSLSLESEFFINEKNNSHAIQRACSVDKNATCLSNKFFCLLCSYFSNIFTTHTSFRDSWVGM